MTNLSDMPLEILFNIMRVAPETIPLLTSTIRNAHDMIYGSTGEYSLYFQALIDETTKCIQTEYESGTVVLNNLKHGTWKTYINGRVSEEQEYKLGNKHGSYTRYYSNVSLNITAYYINNKLEGEYRIRSPNETAKQIYTYKNNILHGYANYLSENITYEGYFDNGKFLGKWQLSYFDSPYKKYKFHPDGMITDKNNNISFYDVDTIYTMECNTPIKVDIENIFHNEKLKRRFHLDSTKIIDFKSNNIKIHHEDRVCDKISWYKNNIQIRYNKKIAISIFYQNDVVHIIEIYHPHAMYKFDSEKTFQKILLRGNLSKDEMILGNKRKTTYKYNNQQILSITVDEISQVLDEIRFGNKYIIKDLNKIIFISDNKPYAEYIFANTSTLQYYEVDGSHATFQLDESLSLTDHCINYKNKNSSIGQYKNGTLSELTRFINFGTRKIVYDCEDNKLVKRE